MEELIYEQGFENWYSNQNLKASKEELYIAWKAGQTRKTVAVVGHVGCGTSVLSTTLEKRLMDADVDVVHVNPTEEFSRLPHIEFPERNFIIERLPIFDEPIISLDFEKTSKKQSKQERSMLQKRRNKRR